MKKLLIAYFSKRKNNLRKQLNTISPEDKAVVETALEECEIMLDQLSASEEEYDAKTAIEKLTETLNEKMSALEEKVADQPTPENNFLKSANSVSEWLKAIRVSANAINRGSEVFKNAWGKVLKENGISFAEGAEAGFMPDMVRGLIQDKWDKNSNWLNQLNNVGAKKYTIRYNQSEQDEEASRAKGFTEGNTKVEQELVFADKELTTQFVYKLIGLDNLTEFNDDGSLVAYITGELYDQYLYEIRRAILIGDGRTANSAHKIKKIEAISRSASDAFVHVDTYTPANPLVDEIKKLVRGIKNADNDITLFMNSADLDQLCRVSFGANATPQYVAKEVMAAQMGVARIVETDMMKTTAGEARFIACRLNGYTTIGNMMNPAFVSWEKFEENKTMYRLEAPVAGAVEKLQSASVMLNA